MSVKVLVVDDSVVYRSGIRKALSSKSSIEVVKAVSNGELAVEVIKQQKGTIDLITLDLEMPVMDGIEAIKQIRKIDTNVKIIVFSAISERGATKTLEALRLGANDFVTKVENSGGGTPEEGVELIKRELLPRIEALVGRDLETDNKINTSVPQSSDSSKNVKEGMPELGKIDLICIGSSTGGPEALTKILKAVTKKINVPVLIVQHMPPVFTSRYAKSLNEATSYLEISEAKGGEPLMPGKAYLAPGDFHMRIVKQASGYSIELDQGEKECYVRPSVDVTFRSVAENFSGKVLAIILTGMGEDGKRGMVALSKKNVLPCVQNSETSVVWGMPGAVVSSGIAPYVLSLNDFSTLLNRV